MTGEFHMTGQVHNSVQYSPQKVRLGGPTVTKVVYLPLIRGVK